MLEIVHAQFVGEPFLVCRNKNKTYEYSSFATELGHDFVANACEVVRQLEAGEGMSRATWIQSRAIPLGYVLHCLTQLCQARPAGTKAVDLSGADWQSLGPLLTEFVKTLPVSDLMKSRNRYFIGKLIRLMFQKGAIPCSLNLPPLEEQLIRDEPFLVCRNRQKTYEYSTFAADLGYDFVAKACKVVRQLGAEEGMPQVTWIQSRVVPLGNFLHCLKQLCQTRAIGTKAVDLSETDWLALGPLLTEHVKILPVSEAKKKGDRYTLQKFIRLMFQKQAIPYSFELPPLEERMIREEPFLVCRNKHRTYEYSSFAGQLGHDFVANACAAIRNLYAEERLTQAEWIQRRIAPLGWLFDCLTAYCKSQPANAKPEEYSEDDWLSILPLLTTLVKSFSCGEKTKTKHTYSLRTILLTLFQKGVIPYALHLPSFQERVIALPGQSRTTEVGHARKPTVEKELSPYEFKIEEHKRSYSFEFKSPAVMAFVQPALPHFENFLRNYPVGTAKTHYNIVKHLLRHLEERDALGRDVVFFKALTEEGPNSISWQDWERVLYRWRDSLAYDQRSESGNHEYVRKLDKIWQHLNVAHVVPEVVLRGFKGASSSANITPRQSLAQLVHRDAKSLELQASVWDEVKIYFDEDEHSEALEFISSLCASFGSEEITRLPPIEVVKKIHELNNDRLSALRDAAEADFLFWYDHWQLGQRALASAKQTPEQLTYLVDSTQLSVQQRKNNSAELFFSGSDEHRIGNALQYVIATKRGIVTGIHGRYHHMQRSMGGRFAFHGYLHPHPDATLALWVLMMVDTGVNCEVARGTIAGCISPSTPGFSKIRFGAKARANGKVIVDELSDTPLDGQKLSLPTAIRKYQEMSGRYRDLAEHGERTFLLLHEYLQNVHALTEFTARNWFLEFLKRHPGLRGLDARPSMIRPSVLMSIQHKNGEDIASAQTVGDHASSAVTNLHYTGRTPTVLAYSLLIREFTERYQAVVVASIEGATNKLGLSDDEFKRIVSEAHRTGLGVACLDPLAGIQAGTTKGRSCTRLDACCGCSMRYVVATQENVVDLILFNEHLKAHQAEALASRPESWEKRWLPWLVFSDIALGKLSQGETAAVFARAQKEAVLRRLDYTTIPLD